MTTVFTNGCFDVMHAGHVSFLREARQLGDRLVVWLNSDESVQALKGSTRPLQPWYMRALCLTELRCVDEVRQLNSVNMAEALRSCGCQVWAKGGDYTLETLNQEEVATAKAMGIKIVIIPEVYPVHTSKILKWL